MIRKIDLVNFRGFREKILEFTPRATVIIGSNASGKTNILEAIYLLSVGKSFKARVEEEMINYDEDISRVRGQIFKGEQSLDLEVVLTRGQIRVGESKLEKTPRKKLLVNELGKRLIDFIGNFRAVLFGPWDMELVTESPSLRRRFLDNVLSLVDREYRRASLSYEKGLRQRNRLLYRIREEGLSRSQLIFWDKLLIKNGDYISRKREEFIEFANTSRLFNREVSKLSIANYQLEYDKSAISEKRLEQYANEEIAAATTLVGPHRDDIRFKIQSPKFRVLRDLSRYGSRGEQRIGVLWLKIAELSFIEENTGERPTLLLDDIFSELDHGHREAVFEVAKGQQTIITTADLHFVEGFKQCKSIFLSKY
jgi:DNA replication and repair protein RecF